MIRPGTENDLEIVKAIQQASPEAAQWNPQDYLSHNFLIAEEGGNPVGFIVFRDTAPGEREILNLAVAPEFRRRGAARRLVTASLSGLPGDVFLEVRASNTAAIEFYKSLGFQPLSLRPNYYQDPPEAAIVMKFHSC